MPRTEPTPAVQPSADSGHSDHGGDHGGDQGGRRSPAPPPRPAGGRVTLVTRVGCHLCDDARAVLQGLGRELGSWEEIDVDGDAELRAEYGDIVPVVLIDGIEHAYGRIDAGELRAALRA